MASFGIDREPVDDGQADEEESLFAAAQDYAARHGKIPGGVKASPQRSTLSAMSYTLRTESGQLIARLPIERVRDELKQQRRKVFELLRRASEGEPQTLPFTQPYLLRRQTQDVRALAWAISHGRPTPPLPPGRRDQLIAAGLLLCCVLPGLIYIMTMMWRRQRYRQELTLLINRWRILGSPDPADSFFTLVAAANAKER